MGNRLGREPAELLDGDNRSPLAQQARRAKLPLEEHHIGTAVAPDAELAAAIRAPAVVNGEVIGIEIEARREVLVAGLAASERVGGQPGARPFEDVRGEVRGPPGT